MKTLKVPHNTKSYILQNYAKNKTESEFMQEILLPLFENMKFETIYNHGPNELGKDFVLRKENDFAGYDFTAVVVKNGNIDNTSTKNSKNTITDVQRQVNQAFNIPLDDFGGKGRFPSKVIVVCSGRLSNSARSEINNNVEYSRNIDFIPAEKLITLIDKHYSSFFHFQLPEIARYLSNLVEYIRQITSIDSNFSSLIEVFNLNCKKEDSTGKKHSFLKKQPEDIFLKGKNYWIQGGTGSGKTFTIYKLAQKSLDSLKKGIMKNTKVPDKLIIPFYGRANDIKKFIDSNNLIDFLFKLAKKYNQTITSNDIKSWLKDYNVLLVFDEFEQEPKQELIDKIMDYKINQSLPISIVFLSRDFDKSSLEFKSSIEIWKLLDLNLHRVKSALKGAIPLENKKSLALYNDVVEEGIIERVPRTPLAINALSYVFSGDIKATPSNTWEFFDMFFEIILGRWEVGRNSDKILDYNQIRHFLEKVALKMVQEGVRCISVMLLIPIAKEVLQSVNNNEMNPIDFITEVTNFGEITIIRDNEFSFTQKTFQEFLAGCEYVNHHWNREEIIENIVDLNWEDCIIFAAGKKKRDEKLLSSLGSISEKTHSHIFFKMKNIALLVQALYQTELSEKKKALQIGLKTAIKLRDSKEFINGIKKLFNNSDEIFLSLLTLNLFSAFYGRRSLVVMLKEIFREGASDREKAYLFSAFIPELLEHSDQGTIDEMISLLPNEIQEIEMHAITPYLKIEKDISNSDKINQVLKNKKMRKLVTKTHKYMARSIQSKQSKYIK